MVYVIMLCFSDRVTLYPKRKKRKNTRNRAIYPLTVSATQPRQLPQPPAAIPILSTTGKLRSDEFEGLGTGISLSFSLSNSELVSQGHGILGAPNDNTRAHSVITHT
ncbi:hypothetical protein ACFX1X_027811 [Malus domestica]